MKLRVNMVDFWGTTEMARSLSLQGNEEEIIIYPAGISGTRGVAGLPGPIGPSGIQGSHSHSFNTQGYVDRKYRGDFRFGVTIPGEMSTGMQFTIPEVLYTMGSDVQMHFDLEFYEWRGCDLVLYVTKTGVNVMFEQYDTMSVRFLEESSSYGRFDRMSSFFNYDKTDTKADSTVPVLHTKTPPVDIDQNSIYTTPSAQMFGRAMRGDTGAVMVPEDDIFRQMILEDVEKYMVQSLVSILKNLHMESKVLETFSQIPFEYWKLIYHIHHGSYTRNLVKEHISNKYRALCTIAQFMEDSYASSIRGDA